MFKYLQIMCAKYYQLISVACRPMFHLVKVGALSWYSNRMKICVIFGVRFERREVDKK